MTGRDVRDFIVMDGDRGKNLFLFVFLSVIIVLTSFNLSAQEKYDPGFFAGTSYYMGDLNTTGHYALPSFAIGPILRYNFNFRNSLRFHAFYHGLKGNDPEYILQTDSKEFNAKFVDLGLDFEFNWKAYQTAFRKTKASPYVFAGLGYGLRIPPASVNLGQFTIPFGIGYKLNVSRWLSAGIEASVRKTFSDDKIDDATNPPLPGSIAPFGNRDWYFFTGVFATYKIFKFWEDCPTYD